MIAHDVDQLAFALFRPSAGSDALWTVGVAQGQFSVEDVLANFRKKKIKPTMVRTNSIYPLTRSGMVLCFVDPSTMVFGQKDAVTKALDARDGGTPSLLSNGHDDGRDAQRGFRSAVEHHGLQGYADDDATVDGRGGLCHGLRHGASSDCSQPGTRWIFSME